jgi:hypothetical protein
MAEKGGTRILGIVTICVILMSISFSGCFDDVRDGDENIQNEVSFKMIISANNTTSYLIYSPYIYISDSEKIINNIQFIDGLAQISIGDTNRDASYINKAMIINGTGNLTFNYFFSKSKVSGVLTQRKSFDGWQNKYWIYTKIFNNDTISISIDAYSFNDAQGTSWKTEPERQFISSGWSVIYITPDMWESDPIN